jgi:hypothetical protein
MGDWEIIKSKLKQKIALLTNSNSLLTENNPEVLCRLEKLLWEIKGRD